MITRSSQRAAPFFYSIQCTLQIVKVLRKSAVLGLNDIIFRLADIQSERILVSCMIIFIIRFLSSSQTEQC